ncbi:hypothetical protein T492DRAFT_1117296 [Pavlovales sp. CCMP2436]|nr:hypothetical protein T492DRAFT_1117296 [Pavlovales sp. CCMP2436]
MAALAGDAVAAYLAKHRVEELVNDAVNEAVLANSTDPIAHIARALACAAGIELGGAAAPSCATGEDRMTALADVAEGTASPVKLRAARRSSPDELRLVDELTFDEARMAEILLTAGQQVSHTPSNTHMHKSFEWGRYPCDLLRSLDPSVSQRLGPVETSQGTDVFLDTHMHKSFQPEA